MIVDIASVQCGGPGLKVAGSHTTYLFNNVDNFLSPCESYQGVFKILHDSTIVVYFHDDVTVYDENWLSEILLLFENKDCVAVGFGGATGLGNRDLYRKPYNIWNLARSGYASNQTDAEVHGERFGGNRKVAVLDAFCMAVRTEWLASKGGWPVGYLTHHCLDLWLACEAARDGKEIWMTGVSCTHHGGGSSTKPSYGNARWLQGGTMESDHQIPHRWLWEEYRDVLPIEVKF